MLKKSILALTLASSSLALASPVYAQNEAVATKAAEAVEAAEQEPRPFLSERERKELDTFMNAWIGPDRGPIDPQRLALAQDMVKKLLPDGAYDKLIFEMIDKTTNVVNEMDPHMSSYNIYDTTGVYLEGSVDVAKSKAITAILDPQFEKRKIATADAIKPAVSRISRMMEPRIREGMAKAYARKFTGTQLGELNAFLSTPTGELYASEMLALQMDDDVIRAMVATVPDILPEFEKMEPEVKAAMDKLPKQRGLSDLNKKEMKQLAALLGTTVAELEKHRDGVPEEATAAATVDAAGQMADKAKAAEYAEFPEVDDDGPPAYDGMISYCMRPETKSECDDSDREEMVKVNAIRAKWSAADVVEIKRYELDSNKSIAAQYAANEARLAIDTADTAKELSFAIEIAAIEQAMINAGQMDGKKGSIKDAVAAASKTFEDDRAALATFNASEGFDASEGHSH